MQAVWPIGFTCPDPDPDPNHHITGRRGRPRGATQGGRRVDPCAVPAPGVHGRRRSKRGVVPADRQRRGHDDALDERRAPVHPAPRGAYCVYVYVRVCMYYLTRLADLVVLDRASNPTIQPNPTPTNTHAHISSTGEPPGSGPALDPLLLRPAARRAGGLPPAVSGSRRKVPSCDGEGLFAGQI